MTFPILTLEEIKRLALLLSHNKTKLPQTFLILVDLVDLINLLLHNNNNNNNNNSLSCSKTHLLNSPNRLPLIRCPHPLSSIISRSVHNNNKTPLFNLNIIKWTNNNNSIISLDKIWVWVHKTWVDKIWATKDLWEWATKTRWWPKWWTITIWTMVTWDVRAKCILNKWDNNRWEDNNKWEVMDNKWVIVNLVEWASLDPHNYRINRIWLETLP
jgi:hypothetical protein